MSSRKVIVIGLDGLDPILTEAMMLSGDLPALAALRDSGGYARLGTTLPAQTPVAWSTFAVGANPGAHGIFDFLGRDPETYLPEIGLYRHEGRSRLLPPKAVNLRGGRTVWDRLSGAGIPSVILRHPCTYPPASFKGRLLAGVGVPDVRGGFGSPSFHTAEVNATAGKSEHLFHVEPDENGRVAIELPGPIADGATDLRLTLELQVRNGPTGPEVVARDGSLSPPLTEGSWSPWVPVRFKHGILQSVRGLVRFFLVSADPFRLFATPVNFHPDAPPFPISHPWDYAGELRRALGSYATLGMAEEHNGATNGRIDEGAFLSQCTDVMLERRAMMLHELGRFDRGLFYCLFDTPDRVQHIFWRFREPSHPANAGRPPDPAWTGVVEEHYRRCDEIVATARTYADDETLFVVASDHGFTSFQRKVHLNTWLHRNGYLALRNGIRPQDEELDLLRYVDWSRTRAYAVGLAGLYLNLRGREAEGTVAPDDAPALRKEIAGRLKGLADPERGTVAVRDAFPRERVFSGPYVENAPDVLLACAPGYRISSPTAMGGLGPEVITDNSRRWSGDHAVDPSAVPGILFMNAPFRKETPHLVDLAPTILDWLRVPGDEDLEGRSLIS